MKKIIVLVLLLSSLSVYASERHDVTFSYNHENYFSYAMKFGKVNDENLRLHEVHMGWIVNKNNFIGLGVYGSDDNIHDTNSKLGYAGLEYGVLRHTGPRGYYKFGILLGAGGLEKDDNRNKTVDKLLVFEPNVQFGFKMNRQLNLQLGTAFRLIHLVDAEQIDNRDLGGFSLDLGLLYFYNL